MGPECHYVVCVRCGAKTQRPPQTLANRRVRRRPTGEFVVQAQQPEGCRVCGEEGAFVLWGTPESDVKPLLLRDIHLKMERRRPIVVREVDGSPEGGGSGKCAPEPW
jgi:hypothetical protein